MPKSSNSVASRKRRKKILKKAKGYFGRRKNVYTIAKNAVEKGLTYAYRDRKNKKRVFRSLSSLINLIDAHLVETLYKFKRFSYINLNFGGQKITLKPHFDIEKGKTDDSGEKFPPGVKQVGDKFFFTNENGETQELSVVAAPAT